LHRRILRATGCADLTNGTGAVIEIAEGNELVYRLASGGAAGHVGLRLEMTNSLSGASGATINDLMPIRSAAAAFTFETARVR